MLRRVLLTTAAFALLAAPAHAGGTMAKSGSTLVVALDGANDTIHLGMSGADLVVQGTGVSPVAPCIASPIGSAECSTSGITAITVDGGAGNDVLSAVAALTPVGTSPLGAIFLPVTMTGDAGNDVLVGGALPDTLSGGDGNDALYGGPGNDALNGGAGDDFLEGDAGADSLLGGDGDDTASWAPSTAPVTVTLDGVANDGASGEGDDAEVENIIGGHGDDTLIGDSGSNVIEGNDGNDTIDGGAGADQLDGEDGADTIRAQDGFVDRIDCGAGPDGVTRDDFDLAINCETDSHSPLLQPPSLVPVAPAPAATLQVFDTALVGSYTAGRRSTSVHALQITHLQTKVAVTVSCIKGGKSCPFTGAKTLQTGGSTLDLRKALKLHTVKTGVTLTIALAKAGYLTRTTTLTFASKKTPKTSVSCSPPGSLARSACPG
jgi:hypothetical protein